MFKNFGKKFVSYFFLFQEAQGKDGSFKGYKLMTSVSIPVYNKKNHTVSYFLINFYTPLAFILSQKCPF